MRGYGSHGTDAEVDLRPDAIEAAGAWLAAIVVT